jgi:hypothetical protein
VRCGALIALVLAGTPGCVVASSSYGSSEDSSRCPESHPLAPTETVDGVLPEQLLAPYLGTRQGRLTWLVGGDTQLMLTVEHDPDQPIYLNYCATGVHTDAIATLRTEDGALNDSVSATVSAETSVPATRPDYSYDPDYGVTPSALPLSQWQGHLAGKIPWLDRYPSSSVQVQLELGAQRLKLASGALVFSGTLPGASSPDLIEIGTWSPQ